MSIKLKNLSNKTGIPRAEPSAKLNDDVLLIIFDWYRLCNISNKDNLKGWNLERWWYRPIHVCRKWRHLILTSPIRLDLHLVCTYGIPVEAMLSHSPPLPLLIYYPAIPGRMSTADEESAAFALQEPERVRRIHFAAPAPVLCNLFKALDCEFPVLERLSLRSTTESREGSMLPKKLQASLLRHLALSNIALPTQSQLLRQAEDLITLRLLNAPASPEFHPAHLFTQILGMSRLEVLVVQFYAAIPKRRFMIPAHPTPITLPYLKILDFRGGSTYLEAILARINAPLLSTLDIQFFNQLTFNLSLLLQFVRTNDNFRFRSTELRFDKEFVSVIVDEHPERAGSYPFRVKVNCQPLDWQAACAAQICHTLEPLLAEVEILTLGFHKDSPASWRDDIDVELWHGLLRTFSGVKRLQLTGGLVRDLFLSLQLDEGELPLDLLPELQELVFPQVSRRFDNFTFSSHMEHIGRSFREQAIALIEVCRFLSEASLQTYTEDDHLQKIARLEHAGLISAEKTPEAADYSMRVEEEMRYWKLLSRKMKKRRASFQKSSRSSRPPFPSYPKRKWTS